MTEARKPDVVALLREVIDKGLIYWEPQTQRGYVAKADLIHRCEVAIAEQPAPDARPTAWMRGHHSPSTPYGPAEYDVDMVYGDDQPDGDGWVPLYKEAPDARAGAVDLRPGLARADKVLGRLEGEWNTTRPVDAAAIMWARKALRAEMDATPAVATPSHKILAEALIYAESLAINLAKRVGAAPHWKPMSGDLIGLLTQIDNATTGLRDPEPTTPPDRDAAVAGQCPECETPFSVQPDSGDCLICGEPDAWLNREPVGYQHPPTPQPVTVSDADVERACIAYGGWRFQAHMRAALESFVANLTAPNTEGNTDNG